MPVAETASVSLTTSGWTLVADGSLGVTDVLVQLKRNTPILLALDDADPGAGSTTGIQLGYDKQEFTGSLEAGQKLYGRAVGTAVSVTVIRGGP